MDDLISRQAAIEAIGEKSDEIYKTKQKGATYPHDDFFQGMAYAENVVKQLPSAQPEIIYCKDCKHFIREDIEEYTPYGFYNTYFHAFCDKHWDEEQGEYIDVKIDDFCSFAERRREQGG